MTVELVYTERRADMTQERARNFARLLERLAPVSGEDVEVSHYEEVDAERLARAATIVLSGSTAAWSSRDWSELDALGDAVVAAGRPTLGICAGMQLLAVYAGGAIAPSKAEHGFLPIDVHDSSGLLRGFPGKAVVFQDHSHEISDLPEGFHALASSASCAVQAFAAPERSWWGTQFHPEESSPDDPAARVFESFFELVRGTDRTRA